MSESSPMTDAKHTAEPWKIQSFPTDPLDKVRNAGGGTVAHTGDVTYHGSDPIIAMANANRIVACVNACENIPNPADFVKAARELFCKAEQYYHDDTMDKENQLRDAIEAFRAAGVGNE